MDKLSFSVALSATESRWESTLPFVLASLCNQKYDVSRLEVIITGDERRLGYLSRRFPTLSLRFLAPVFPGIHLPTRHRREMWRVATNEVFLAVDADVVLPAHLLSHLDQLLRARPNILLYGRRRLSLTADEVSETPIKRAQEAGLNDYRLAGRGGQRLVDQLLPLHPLGAASYLMATRRSLIEEADFCLEYDGAWGVEDHDFAFSLYRRGVEVMTHRELAVWHFDHPRQSNELYASQLSILRRRQGDLGILNQDDEIAVWHHLQSRWPAAPDFSDVAFHGHDVSLLDSGTLSLTGLYLATFVLAARSGGPRPRLGDWSRLNLHVPLYQQVRKAGKESAERRNEVRIHVWMVRNEQLFVPPRRRAGEYHIAYLPLEGAVVLPRTRQLLASFDEVWTPNRMGADALHRSGWAKPVIVIPHGVWSQVFFPPAAPRARKPVRFLAVGSGQRKNHYDLLRLFVDNFSPSDEVELIVVDSWQGQLLSEELELYHSHRRHQIKIYSKQLALPELVRLYQSADAVVSLSSGEAWQLPLLEAALCGATVIAPRGNGVPYLTNENALLYHARPIETNSVSGWVEPDRAAAARVMREFCSDPARWSKRGETLRRQAVRELTWSQAGELALARLEEIRERNG